MSNAANDERTIINFNRSASPQVVNLVLQGKGRVGKSLIASFLAQFYKARGHSVKCVDTDPVNQTFSQYAGIGAQHLKLMSGNQIDRRQFDDLIEEILSSDESYVVDNGAATFIPLWHYMLENSIVRVLREAKRRLLIHTVLTGGQALADTLAGFKSLAETSDSRNVIAWVNEYFGLVRRDGKDFTEMAAYPSASQETESAAGREVSQLGTQITRKNLNVQPTIKIPAGYKFNVRVNRDILFEEPYQPVQHLENDVPIGGLKK
jgi:hypothetical protein